MVDKKILIFLSIILLFLFVKSALATDAEAEKVVFYNGIKLYGKLNDKSDFVVSLFMEPYKDTKVKYSSKFWGYDKPQPTNIIKELSVIIRGKKLIIPENAIKDLADIIIPEGLFLMQTSRTIVLYIEGGDAAGSYTAALKFVDGKLVSRTIEFMNSEGAPDSVTTKYQ